MPRFRIFLRIRSIATVSGRTQNKAADFEFKVWKVEVRIQLVGLASLASHFERVIINLFMVSEWINFVQIRNKCMNKLQ